MLKLGIHKTFKGKRLYKEVWKDVVGYEGLYKVSNLGRVKGLDRIIEYEDGRIYYMKGGMMKTTINNKGYESLRLSKNHTRYNKTVHRLVIEAFIPNFDNKPCIDHINGIRTDNRIQNLRWVTYKENMNNEITRKRSSEAKKGKERSEETKIKIRKGMKNCKRVICVETGVIYESATQAGKKTGIPQANISRACREKHRTAYGFHWRTI